MYLITHLTLPFFVINLAVAYLIFQLVKRPTISKSFFYTAFMILCIAAVVSNLYGFWVVYHWSADTWVHLTLINETINNGLFPSDPFFQNQPNILYYSLIHWLCAELHYFIEVPPHVLLIPIASLAVLLRILFVFVWIRYLLNNEKLALLAISLYAVSSGSFFGPTFHWLWYPFSLGITVSNLTFLFMLKSLKEDRLKFAVVSALFFSIVLMFHLIMGIFLFISLLGFLFFYAILKEKPQKRICYSFIIILAVGIVLSLLWLGWIVPPYFNDVQSPSNLVAHGIGTASNSFVFRWGNRFVYIAQFKIVSPWYLFNNVFNQNSILISLAIIGFLKFLQNYKAFQTSESDVYLFSNTILPIVFSFIPPLFSIVFLKGYIIRIMILIPQLVFATIGLEWICTSAIRRISFINFRSISRSISKHILMFILIFLIIGISSLPRYVYYVNIENIHRSEPMIFEWEEDFTWLKAHSNRKDIILSDPWTSYYIPYFAERKIVAKLPAHSPTFSIDDRLSDAILALNTSTPITKTLEIIKKYNVSYVLLNLRPLLDANYSGCRKCVETYYTLDAPSKFNSASSSFKEVYYVNGVWIFEIL